MANGVAAKFRFGPLGLVCLALSFSASAIDGETAPTHCKSGEGVIFSCLLNTNKTVSLCASPYLARDAGTLQYRFGQIGQRPELTYPKPTRHPRGYFSLSSSYGGLWSQHELVFSAGQFRYEISVQTNSAIPEDGASLSVFRNPHRVARMECRFDSSINNMWMLDELGIPSHP